LSGGLSQRTTPKGSQPLVYPLFGAISRRGWPQEKIGLGLGIGLLGRNLGRERVCHFKVKLIKQFIKLVILILSVSACGIFMEEAGVRRKI
jgi:hypothetical protein